MSIRAIWDNDDRTIVRHIYDGKWSLDDYYALISQHVTMLAEVSHEVDIINDLRSAGSLPPNMASAIKWAARKAPANEGINVIVGANQFVKALIDIVNKTAGPDVTEVTHVDTLEAAYTIIANHRAQALQP